jgi:hypothetical protein
VCARQPKNAKKKKQERLSLVRARRLYICYQYAYNGEGGEREKERFSPKRKESGGGGISREIVVSANRHNNAVTSISLHFSLFFF